MSSHTPSDILSRYAFIEQVNRDYDRYFDDAHVMGYLHIHRLKYYNRMHGIIAGDEIVRRALSVLQVASCDGLVTRYAGNGIVFLSERERVESLAAAINDALPTFGEPNGLLAKIGTVACTSPLNPEDCMNRAAVSTRLPLRMRAVITPRMQDSGSGPSVSNWLSPQSQTLPSRTFITRCKTRILEGLR